MSRKKLIVGSVLVFCLLIANTVHVAGLNAGNARRGFLPVWSLALRSVTSMVRTQVRAGEGPLLVVAASAAVVLVGDDGKERRRLPTDGGLMALATGDLTGDGIDEIVMLTRRGADTAVTALDGGLKALWSRPAASGIETTRVLVVDLDGDRRRDVVVASSGGQLKAFGADGAPRWSWAMPEGPTGEDAQVRGLDDAKAGAERRVAVARRDGQVALLDGRGQQLWAEAQPSKVRRLRVVELGDGGSSLLIGREDGACWRVRERGAPPAFRGDTLAGLGEPVTEIRAVEVDGNDKTRELAVGGKNGRVVVVGAGSADVQAKISAMAGADVDGDGRDELLVGTETGVVHLLTARGDFLAEIRGQGKVDALLSVPGNGGSRLLVLASANGVSAQRYDVQDAPAWYHPASAAVLGTLGLVGVALALSRLRPVAIEPMAPAADLPAARRTQLEEAWKRVAALLEGGHAKAEDVQERLDQLRKQIEATDRQATRAVRPLVSSPPPPKRK